MSKNTIALFAFIAGCGAAITAPLVIPPAHAQTTQRWETFCTAHRGNSAEVLASKFTEAGNMAGREGWEPLGHDGTSGIICFKRPAP